MAQKKSYSRYFIILQEDEPGYSLASDKLPSGYTKLETKNDKCKVSYYVQNLKRDKEPYYMVLICNKKDAKKLIRIGTLNIDEYGRAEITYEFSADNISGSKMPIDVVGGSAIVRMEGSSIVPVMSGFASTESPKDWRSYSLYEEKTENSKSETRAVENKVKKEVDISEDREESSKVSPVNEEKNIFEEYEQKIEAIKQVETERNEIEVHQDSEDVKLTEVDKEGLEEKVEAREVLQENSEEKVEVRDVVQENVEEKVTINNIQDTERVDDEHISLNDTRHKHDHHKDKEDCGCEEKKKCGCEDKKDYPIGTVGEFFKLLAEDFEEVKDICTEIKRCRWYKVPVKNLEDMCGSVNYNKYTVAYYPMISYYPYIKKHGHYMLGYKYDSKGKMKYLVYAIPGTKSRADQPFGGKSGFVTWVPIKEGDEKDDSFGYWLMFYDFRTSTIVIPVK